jgi:hypothetical protein
LLFTQVNCSSTSSSAFNMKSTQLAYIIEVLSLLKAANAQVDSSLIAWNAYGKIVNQWLTGGATPRPGIDYIFVTPPTVGTLQAGTPIPQQVTNAQLFKLADTLQRPDAPIFDTTGDSYVTSLDA